MLAGGSASLAYNLYLDTGRTRIWGDGEAGTYDALLVSGINYPLYGRIPAQPLPPPGEYRDQLEITVEW